MQAATQRQTRLLGALKKQQSEMNDAAVMVERHQTCDKTYKLELDEELCPDEQQVFRNIKYHRFGRGKHLLHSADVVQLLFPIRGLSSCVCWTGTADTSDNPFDFALDSNAHYHFYL